MILMILYYPPDILPICCTYTKNHTEAFIQLFIRRGGKKNVRRLLGKRRFGPGNASLVSRERLDDADQPRQ